MLRFTGWGQKLVILGQSTVHIYLDFAFSDDEWRWLLWCAVHITTKKLSYCRDSARRPSLRHSRSFQFTDVSISQKPICTSC